MFSFLNNFHFFSILIYNLLSFFHFLSFLYNFLIFNILIWVLLSFIYITCFLFKHLFAFFLIPVRFFLQIEQLLFVVVQALDASF